MNDDLDSNPVDLSPLDPTRDSVRFDAIASGLARDAMRELTSNRDIATQDEEGGDVFDRLARWWPRTLVAAGLVLAVSIPGLLRSTDKITQVSAMDVLGLSPELSTVLRSRQTPSLSELRAALANSAQ